MEGLWSPGTVTVRGGGLLPGSFAIRHDAGLGRSCRSKAFGQDMFSVFFSMERLHDMDTISSPWS